MKIDYKTIVYNLPELPTDQLEPDFSILASREAGITDLINSEYHSPPHQKGIHSSIYDVGFPTRVTTALTRFFIGRNIVKPTVKDLACFRREEFLRTLGFGKTSLRDVRRKLAEYNLDLIDELCPQQ